MDGGEKRQFILTASSAPQRREGMKSAAGNIATLRMRTLTLFETGDSDGCVSLEGLFHGGMEPRMTGAVTLQKLASFIVRGGWPGSLHLTLPQAKLMPGRVIDAIVEEGAVRLDGVRRNKTKMRLLLRALARCESTTASSRALRRDILAADGNGHQQSDHTRLSGCTAPSLRPGRSASVRSERAVICENEADGETPSGRSLSGLRPAGSE